MSIFIYPPDAQQDKGFYSFLIESLQRCAGARMTADERPLPRLELPRRHESLWINWNGIRVLVDMSDHIFLFDLPALQLCDLYLKANLNVSMAERVLTAAGVMDCLHKVKPFLFLSPSLGFCRRIEKVTRFTRMGRWRPFDFCHVVGVYNNPFLEGVPSAVEEDIPPDPEETHFWIRYQIQQALLSVGLKGFTRLTNRTNPALLDRGGVVRANMSIQMFLLAMMSSRVTVINTLPHAVFPWKVMESIALGIPFVVERRPQIVMPEEMELVPGEHYLELLPELPDLDKNAAPEELKSYRLFPRILLERLKERAEWLKGELRDRERMTYMLAAVESYRKHVLTPEFISVFFADQVKGAVNAGGSNI
ncbi:MAG: hypothetical protein IH612_01585 [Desulfofustis sp.]|nr:hypothetical protein [Desulfofustis sp.]